MKTSSFFIVSFSLTALLVLNSCGKDNRFQAAPAPVVTAESPQVRDVTLFETFPGRVEASDSVYIVARVSGFLEKVHFIPGAIVKAGDLLFTIEQTAYIAALNTAKADHARAVASLNLARAALSRRRQAFQSQAVSELDILSSEAEVQAAEAAVKAASAGVERAELNLSYTKIVAPMDGLISRNEVSVGNLVGPGATTQLSRLVSVDKAHVFFNIDERRLVPRLRSLANNATSTPIDKLPPVNLELVDGKIYDVEGKIDFIDNVVDPQTGTMQIRAVFENSDGLLFSGMFARVKIPTTAPQALLIPEVAIQRDLVGPFVFTLNSENQVLSTYLELGALVDGSRIVNAGLKPTDKVVVSGIQRIRPGIQVALSKPASSKEEGE
jgi:multidrug efflux system membrane fusion protein